MTGWNLPPGCSYADIERAAGIEGPCFVCGQGIDDCICPECPECGSQGDPLCYDGGIQCDDYGRLANHQRCFSPRKHTHRPLASHGLVRTPEQIAAKAAMDEALAADAAAEAAAEAYWAECHR